jgi:two-component system, cell cycle sensor histidine kinase and response regulator CckA
MTPDARPLVLRYGVAALSSVVAVGLHALIGAYVGGNAFALTLLLAVTFSAWYGGFGPTLAALALGCLGIPLGALLAPAAFDNTIVNPPATLGMYLLVGLAIAWFGASMRLARRRAERSPEEAGQRARAESALAAAEGRFRTLVEQSIVGFYIIQDDRFTYVNPKLAEILGYSTAELTSRPVLEFIAAEDRPLAAENIRKRLAGTVASIRYALRLVHRDGRIVHVDVHGTRTEYAGGPAILGVLMDVTEHRRATEQLRQAQKMEAIGRLAGGVAHDFNNMLTVIFSYSEMLLDLLEGQERARTYTQEIYKAGERAALLTRQLLAFSRKQILDPVVLDLNGVVRDVEKMLGRVIGEDFGLKTVLAGDLSPVKVDPGQVEQVVMNLVLNARDAMPQGGKITVETANVELDENYARSHPDVRPGRYAMLAVSDTGHGMDEATKARVFEPFFTTKEPGKGTGLGLATVYGIVKQSGGSIGVYSEPGHGAAFKVYFPVVAESAAAVQAQPRPATLHGTETVLVVEDEAEVRILTRTALENHGYTVLEASRGEEALEVADGHPIHLLVTDVVMPGLNGRQVAESLRACQPALKVLFISGYTDDAVVRHGVLQAEAAFLQKPFTAAGLANKVREVLDG